MVQKFLERPSLAKNVAPQELDFSFKELSISILPPTGTYDFGRETGQARAERREGFDERRLMEGASGVGALGSGLSQDSRRQPSVSLSAQQINECGYCTGCTTCTQCTGCTACTPCTQCTSCTPTNRSYAQRSNEHDGLVLGELKMELEELLLTK